MYLHCTCPLYAIPRLYFVNPGGNAAYIYTRIFIYLSPVGGGGESEDEMVKFALGLLDHVKSTRLSKEVGGASTHTHTLTHTLTLICASLQSA